MLKTVLLSLCFLAALLLVGCSKTETTTNSNSTATNSNKSATTSSAPASNSATTAGEKIGVPECDQFIAAYDACISGHVPEAARAQFKAGLAQWRKSWHDLAANPATKGTLTATCKQAAEQARTTMKSYNCTF